MKKRLLSWLMALTLCLALLPAAALANGNGVEDLQLTGEQKTILSGEEGSAAPGEQQETQLAEGALLPAAEPAALMASGLFTQAAGHDHCLCGAAHKDIGTHTTAWSITFTAWTDELAEKQNGEGKTAANSLPKQGNNYYYLTQDVELSTSWKPADGTVLCLNGHSITSKSINCGIHINDGVTFTLTDCNGSGKTYRFADGDGYYDPWKRDDSGSHTVIGGILTAPHGSGVYIQKGTFNMYGGTIVGNSGNSNNKGGGVFIGFNENNNTFNMYGGAITGNRVSGSATNDGGAGVYVRGSTNTFNMYGGEITNNATTRYASGGGVNVYDGGTFHMYGGIIGGEGKGNTSSWGGGGVYVSDSTFTMSGTAKIANNTESRSSGGGVDVSGGTFTMSDDAKIINNKTTGSQGHGGGVCMSDGQFTMSGNATITGNSCGSTDTYYNGGGVFVSSSATLTVSGNVQITGNTKNNKANNVYLGQYNNDPMATVTIGEEDLDTNAKIGVTAKTPSAGLVIATGATENKNYTEIITSDDDTYEVAHDSSDATKLVLKVAPEKPHEHFLCGGDNCTKVGEHTENGKTTFDTKLWMDGATLKMGDKEWTLGKVERADSSSGDKEEGYALSEGTYYLGTDLKLNGTPILISGDVKLCLNGHTIDQAYRSGAISSLIRIVGKNANLTLTDCVGTGKLTGGKYGGVDVFGGCTLDMFGGTITGNEINGGVSIGQIGTFNMYDGKITGNRAEYGGGVLNGGTFNMYGGEISGNTATNCGGGVYVAEYSTAFKVSGAAKITDNTVNGAANNVYLPSGKTFTLGSHFTKDTYIGVTTAEKPTDKKHVTIVSDAGTMSYDNVVKADDSENYKTQMDGADLVLAVKNGGTTPTEHEHFLCGGDNCTKVGEHQDSLTTFTAWTDELAKEQYSNNTKTAANSLPNTAGNYYLTDNVTLQNYWKPASGTVLCLNGHDITMNANTEPVGRQVGAIVVSEGYTFTLVDCKGGKTEYGQITHGTNTETGKKYTGRGVCVYGTFNMYGGNITGNELTQEWYCGGGVSVFAAAGIFNLYGGSITNNKSNNTSTASPCGEGGGVYTIGKFTMYDGTISGNEAYRDGGGVYTVGANGFTMYGGSITGNTARGQHYEKWYIGGGGVFVASGNRDDAGIRFTMKGGTISNNTAYGAGGGVYVEEYYGSFVMEGGTISGNRAVVEDSKSYYAGKGGGVYVDGEFTMQNGSITGNSAVNGGGVCAYGDFTMTGGTIGGTKESDANTAGENGGGVYMDNGASGIYCKMSGDVKVIGNKKNGEANNYYGRTITIGTDGLGDNAKIGMNMGSSWPTNTYGTRIARQAKESDQDKFTSDKEGYEIKYNEREKELRLAKIAALTRIAVPTAKTGLIYNGEQQTGVVSGTGYTITGNTATSAGSYTATAALKSGYTWSDGSTNAKTISWSIAKKAPAAADFTFTVPTDLAYNGSAKTAEVAVRSGINGMGEVTTVKYYQGETAVQPINAGVYTVKIDVAEGANYTDAKDLTTGDWTFTISGGEVVPPAHTHTYGAWSYDAEKHWHECTDATCPNKPDSIKDTAAHVYGGADDVTCNVCGYTRELTPPSAVPVTGITLNITSAALKVGETVTLTAAVEPSNATNGNVTWASSDSAVAAVSNGVVTAVKEGTAVITATAADSSGIFASCTVTVTAAPAPGGSTGGDFVPGGEISSTVTTKTNPDGSVTRTETKSDGTVIETTANTDGSTTRTTVRKDGSSVIESREANGTTGTVRTDTTGKTEAEAKVSEKAIEDAKKSGGTVKVPVEVRAGENSDTAPTVKVELPRNAGETEIEIPVAGVSSGTVAVIVHPDGTEEIVKASKPTENGIQLAVKGSTTIKIIDNSKDFIDTRSHWSRDEVNFVVSRELFNGVGNNLFGVKQTMTRGMVNTVLARLAGVDTTPKAGQKWYEVGTEWAKANGISDGTNPEASVTREQLATLLYRFSGSPAVSGRLNFTDAREVRDYAQNALLWATQNGIINGVGGGRIAPGTDAQRAQVAAMMARYLKNL